MTAPRPNRRELLSIALFSGLLLGALFLNHHEQIRTRGLASESAIIERIRSDGTMDDFLAAPPLRPRAGPWSTIHPPRFE